LGLIGFTAGAANTALRINVQDIISEVERKDLREIAVQFFEREYNRLKNTRMTEYKTGFCTNAGILGIQDAINEVIAYINIVGIEVFLSEFFPTKEHFNYYDGSQDRCIVEWKNIVAQKKYNQTRKLMALLLGEMKASIALPELETVLHDPSEALDLKELTASAIKKIKG
jgi:hypothetical protein